MSSACLNLDRLSSSSDDDLKDLAGLRELSITLLCDSEEVLTPVNSDQAEGQKTGRPEARQSAGLSDSGGGSGQSGM